MTSEVLTLLNLLYQLAVAAAGVFLLVLAWRFVRALERIAGALERRAGADAVSNADRAERRG